MFDRFVFLEQFLRLAFGLRQELFDLCLLVFQLCDLRFYLGYLTFFLAFFCCCGLLLSIVEFGGRVLKVFKVLRVFRLKAASC